MADTTKDDHYNGLTISSTGIIVIITSTISLYNAVELLLLIAVTFQRWGGTYFWSLLVASFGVIPYSLGYLLDYYELTYSPLGLAINNIGWWLMVTGQSFVLYSRLHLVVNDRRILRAVLAMIIVDALIFHIPTTTLNYYSNYGRNHNGAEEAAMGYKVYEKVQMTGFCLQEFVISGLYLWKTVKLLQVVTKDDARRTMWQLFAINFIIVAMDIALLTIEYCNLRIYEQVFKGVFYSVKVKLEYAILGKLVQIAKGNDRTLSFAFRNDSDTPDSADIGGSRLGSTSTVQKGKLRPGKSVHIENILTSECGISLFRKQSAGSPEELLPSEGRGMDEKPKQGSAGELYADFVRQITRDS